MCTEDLCADYANELEAKLAEAEALLQELAGLFPRHNCDDQGHELCASERAQGWLERRKG